VHNQQNFRVPVKALIQLLRVFINGKKTRFSFSFWVSIGPLNVLLTFEKCGHLEVNWTEDIIGLSYWIEIGPNPTRAYFWLAVNKRLICLWPRYFLTQPNEILLIQGKEIEKFGEIFQTQTKDGRPDLSNKTLIQSRSKIFDPEPSLLLRHCDP